MTTSGVYSFSVSRDDIIREAMLNIGKLGEGETPSSQEISDCARKLNMLVKQWQGRTDFSPGLKTWTRRHGHLFLNTTTNQYTLGPNGVGWTNSFSSTTATAVAASGQPVITVASTANISVGDSIGVQVATSTVGVNGNLQWTTVSSKTSTTVTLAANLTGAVAINAQVYSYTTTAQQPIWIETAILRDINNNDIPLRVHRDVQSYDFLPSKGNPQYTSNPTSVYYEFQLGNGTLFTDVGAAQDITYHIVMSYLEAEQDFVNPSDTPEYPQEWFRALSWGLSREIAPMFNAPWTQLMDIVYNDSIANARSKEPEISTIHFQPREDDL